MKGRLFVAAAPYLLLCGLGTAQECKLKFAVAYTDGKALQIGFTEDQKKFWEHDGAKKFKGMCIDAQKPAFLILWSEGLSGAEINKAAVDNFNRGRATGQNASGAAGSTDSASKGSTTDSGWTDRSVYIRPSSVVRAKADYWILDTSTNPYSMIRKGQGYRDVPVGLGQQNRPGQSMDASDLASTIADPVNALENALKWLKKEKKL